jgi:hypothetical protein
MSKAKDGSERRRGADALEALVGGWFASSESLADVEYSNGSTLHARQVSIKL